MKKYIVFVMFLIVSALTGCSSKQGMLSGVFSVSDTLKVVFSFGNLQYEASSKTYRFAENQWEVISGENFQKPLKTYDSGYCDVFEWGSGDNPFQKTDVFEDWGKNPISNGGNKQGLWRTLTSNEWLYLIEKRPFSENLISFAIVNNTKGVIILPDNWQKPLGADFYPLPKDSFIRKNGMIRLKNPMMKMNVYNLQTWEIMENSGAIFLPFNDLSSKDNPSGKYWANDEENFFSFESQTIWPKRGCRREAFRMGVRLVKNIE